MQYLLTEEEYKALHQKIYEKEHLPTKKALQEFCTRVADNMPVTVSWFYEGKPTPWGCIITEAKKDRNFDHYCDECPARKICPYNHKHFSQ